MNRASAVVVCAILGAIIVTAVWQSGFWCAEPASTQQISDPSVASHTTNAEGKKQIHGSGWHSDSRSGYRIRIPPSWRFVQNSARLVRSDAISPDGQAGLQVRIQEPFAPEKFDTFIDTYLQSFINDMEGHWGGHIAVHTRVSQVIGVSRGMVISMDFHRADGSQWFFKHYLLKPEAGENRLVFMQAGCPWQNRAENEAHFDFIAASLVFDGI